MAVSPAFVRLPPLPTIRDLIRLYKLRALKQLSQNFLLDERITDKIVKTAGNISNHYICEVGPGPGSITRSIIRRNPKKLFLVEKDPRFLPTLELLKESCENHVDLDIEINDIRSFNFENKFHDVFKCDWFEAPPKMHIIGNLPFNVSTNLLIRWIHAISEKQSAWIFGRTPMTLTFQKEVAERIVAPENHSQRCRLSVMCQMWAEVEHRFTIPGTAFIPKPDVDVGVVTIYPKKYPLVKLPFPLVEKVVRSVFNMRQKQCKRGAEILFPPEERESLCEKFFDLANVRNNLKPYQLSNDEFGRLCYAYKVICDERPDIATYDFRAPRIFSKT